VLYVDDEDALVYLIKRALEDLGYRVTTHTDPVRALEDFRARPGEFAAVVSDVAMHGMSGLELAREIRALRTDVPVVLTSGYVRQEVADAARSIGVRDVILKPSTVDALGTALHRVIATPSA
jgi:CheY-like chemotaxis protein